MAKNKAKVLLIGRTVALVTVVVAATAFTGAAATYHRSFRNGYPSGAQGVTVRQQPNAAVLTAPKASVPKSVTVTNRVVITKEQAEKMLKGKSRKFIQRKTGK